MLCKTLSNKRAAFCEPVEPKIYNNFYSRLPNNTTISPKIDSQNK
jgi:hypothetical protein